MRPTLPASAAVAAAVALGSAAAAGAPLYVSSSATADLHAQFDATCLADAGLRTAAWTLGEQTQQARREIDELAHVETAIETMELPVRITDQSGREQPAVLVARAGQEAERGIEGLETGGAAAPASAAERYGIGVGDTFSVGPAFGPPEMGAADLKIVAAYPDVSVHPEPAFWCGLRSLFRPSGFGDLPPPVLLVSPQTIQSGPGWFPDHAVEWRPATDGMTRAEADSLAAAFARGADRLGQAVTDELGAMSGEDVDASHLGISDTSQLARLVDRAEVSATVVSRTMTPVLVAALAAAGLVLVAAGLLVARGSMAELRLRAMRGTGPLALTMRIGAAVAPAGAIGTVGGIGLAVAAVVAFGPSSLLEPGAVRAAALLGAVAGSVGTITVAVTAAEVTARSVDSVAGRHWAHRVPWELVPVALAVVSSLRLDQVGGVQIVGARAQGGDVLAQAFPLLAIVAVLAVLVRPVHVALRALRRRGERLPLGLLLGIRRLSSDASVTVATTMAAALVVGLAVFATTATASAEQSLRDKARTFVGTDLVVRALGDVPLPESLAGRASIVRRLDASDEIDRVDVLGVDMETFGDGMHWISGAAGRSASSFFDMLTRSPRAGADVVGVAVGGAVSSPITTAAGYNRIDIDVVGSLPWFPGLRSGQRLLVVPRNALTALDVTTRQEIWIRDAPADAAELLAAGGWRPVLAIPAAGVFDAGGYRAMRYAFGTFGALAGLGMLVLVVAQLLVIDARRRRRSAATVINKAIGLNRRVRVTATLIEFAVPLVAGTALGVLCGLATFTVASEHLDPLRTMSPPARVVVDAAGIAVVLGAAAVAVLGLVVVALTGGRRSNPMEAMRGG